MKKFLAGLMAGVTLATGMAVLAETTDTIEVIFDRVKLVVNGETTDTSTLLYDGRTYIQLRGAADAFGAELDWDADTNTATLTTTTEAPVAPDGMEPGGAAPGAPDGTAPEMPSDMPSDMPSEMPSESPSVD